MLACLFVALSKWSFARIHMLSIEEATQWVKQIENYEPWLRRCFGVADGMLIPLQHDTRYSRQLLYNGMAQVYSIKQVNVFRVDETIIAGGTNFLGSFHNTKSSTLTGYNFSNIYKACRLQCLVAFWLLFGYFLAAFWLLFGHFLAAFWLLF